MVMAEQPKRKGPDWARRASSLDSKPNWVDVIPHRLHELGEVFFPIPNMQKGWSYPHHLDSHRYSATDEILNAYLEAGFNYGVACAEDLVVIDVDDLRFVDIFADRLPETVHQKTGSREGFHLFYRVEGLTAGKNLIYAPYDPILEKGERRALGEVRCNPHQYVVGPGSIHPSGNRYGPLRGESIARVDREEFLDAIDELVVSRSDTGQHARYEDRPTREEWEEHGGDAQARHPFYNLDADDVLPWLEPDSRIAHPIHGSDTGSNFMKNEGGETFICWRCQYGASQGCGLSAQHFLALQAVGNRLGDYACEEIRHRWRTSPELHYLAWREAVKEGLVWFEEVPYIVLKGYAFHNDIIEDEEELLGVAYWDILEQLKYETEAMLRELENWG